MLDISNTHLCLEIIVFFWKDVSTLEIYARVNFVCGVSSVGRWFGFCGHWGWPFGGILCRTEGRIFQLKVTTLHGGLLFIPAALKEGSAFD